MPDDQGAECKMPTPTAEHEMLLRSVGTWNVDCTYWMGPETMKCSATEVIEAVGGFWTLSRFTSDFMGMPFVGRCTVGYDPAAKKWVGSWIDSMSSHMFVMSGDFDAARRTLTMHARGPSMQTGEMTDFRMVTIHRDENHFTFDMYMALPGGGECQMFHYEYTRAA